MTFFDETLQKRDFQNSLLLSCGFAERTLKCVIRISSSHRRLAWQFAVAWFHWSCALSIQLYNCCNPIEHLSLYWFLQFADCWLSQLNCGNGCPGSRILHQEADARIFIGWCRIIRSTDTRHADHCGLWYNWACVCVWSLGAHWTLPILLVTFVYHCLPSKNLWPLITAYHDWLWTCKNM